MNKKNITIYKRYFRGINSLAFLKSTPNKFILIGYRFVQSPERETGGENKSVGD